ncbi:hypothetical protein V1477_008656 [Vespula maculifrons]|uniref:Uncharacterized protein n=1 Tax=Vespula maculifrons TaxID=7453 RepID=A0ABD2CDM6_VESMC
MFRQANPDNIGTIGLRALHLFYFLSALSSANFFFVTFSSKSGMTFVLNANVKANIVVRILRVKRKFSRVEARGSGWIGMTSLESWKKTVKFLKKNDVKSSIESETCLEVRRRFRENSQDDNEKIIAEIS